MNTIVRDTLEWMQASGTRVKSKEEFKAKMKKIRAWLEEEVKEFEDAMLSDDKPGMLNAVVDAKWILNNLSYHAGLTHEEINEEAEKVRLSNFSKYCHNREEAQESVRLYEEGIHPNKMGQKIRVIYKLTGNKEYPYVLLRTDGKILKSHKFKDVDQFNLNAVK